MLMITRMYKWLQVCLAVVSQYNKSISTVEDPIVVSLILSVFQSYIYKMIVLELQRALASEFQFCKCFII